jgi:hypothetical protein
MAGQYTLAGATPGGAAAIGGSSYHINNLVLAGVQNVSQLEDELQKRTGQRARTRRGPS